ncbi:U32 family peptidase [Parasulfuritortus cantonensis]|uniref:U32 family peptidase n=1 Tax=Parasulfuritortus cantonensis TaxID=2528202 RepID=A0A4R1BDV6_9PROT|nr:U32 family peptidase [Parasulfuritortus cantonensis]TCJ15269.1 U32 family peptidase [Parasulfuritortus cantonensis]
MLAHQLELLAPARDVAIGIEAVNHGADAVYIGGPSFGARSNADNSVAEIARLVEHAHRYHARIYATLNTILRDDELDGARALAWQFWDAGVDALIIQDMGLLELDLPPIQLHASTQCDIRTPEKAAFLEAAGFSQLVLARELSLDEIAAIRAATTAALEFFVHGALCVAYSGQCYISHAQTGRSANRGDCSQACRLPYQVTDAKGRIVAHDKHVLSLKDNNQSDNLDALVDVGIRSFKIEGRYKDMGYVKNVTAHYRRLLDEILERRPDLAPASSGRCTCTFTPDPELNFNRGATDYFVQGRKQDIGAFDSPKNPGRPIGWATRVGPDWVEIETEVSLNNGDGLCYYDLQKELTGLAINEAEPLGGKRWRVRPKDRVADLKDLRPGTEINRNRDQSWQRVLDRKSAERRIGVHLHLADTPDGLALTLIDADGFAAGASAFLAKEPAKDAARAEAGLRDNLAKLGTTIFEPTGIVLDLAQPWFVPASAANQLRREAVAALEAVRAAGLERLPRAPERPAVYPEDSLSYLANVYNGKARDFYARHGVKLIAAAYESHEEEGEVSLMITKHCVRYSLSLCPRQTQGVTGVHGTIKAEPLSLVSGDDKLTLRFDCKACEMHVMGKLKRAVQNQRAKELKTTPMRFYKARPGR